MSSSSWDAPDNETFFDNTLSEDPFASGFQADDETAEDLARMKADQQDNMLAMLGMKPMMDTQPLPMLGSEQFLQSTKRGAMERATYATGCSYMAGIALGGVRGLFVGLRNAPNRRLRIKLNSVLNACGRGARLGNSLGVIAAAYVGFEALLDNLDFDKHVRMPGSDWVTPITAAACTGAFYRSTAGLPVALAAGAVGAIAGTALFVGVPYLRYHYGDDVPLLRVFKM